MEEPRVQVIQDDPDRWKLRDTLRVVGWGLLVLACLLIFPLAGDGGGRAQESGSDLLRALAFHRGTSIAALVLAATGLVVLLVNRLVASSDPA